MPMQNISKCINMMKIIPCRLKSHSSWVFPDVKDPDAWLLCSSALPLLHSACLWLALLKETVIKLMSAKTSFFSLYVFLLSLLFVHLLGRSWKACPHLLDGLITG